MSSLCSGLTGDPVSSFQVPPVSCHPEDLETLPDVAEVRAQGLRSWGGGRQSAGGQTGLSDPCSLHSWQPCLPRTKFHCPLVFKEEILVQVTGTVELVEEIKVAPVAADAVGGGSPRAEQRASPPDGLPAFFLTTRLQSPDISTAAGEREL